MVTDSFTAALGRLDPASRALLDLSLRRGMRPEEIGEMLGSDATSVVVAREQALQQLADELGLSDPSEVDGVRARLAELPAEAWTPGAETAKPAPEPVQEEPVRPQETRERKSRLPWLLLLLAVVVVILIAVLASSGNSSNNEKTPTATAPSKPKPKPSKPAPRKVAMAPVAGAARGAKATAALAAGGKRLLLDVKGLPDPGTDSYQVWLYDSVVRAQSIGAARGTDLNLDLKLPPSANDYSSIDISREPRDGNPNHSGESVLRVPLSKLSP